MTCASAVLHYAGMCGCPPARALVADPAWLFDDALPGRGRGAEKHYECLTIEDLCRLRLPPIAPDCYLFLWRVAAMVEEAMRVVRAWGFVAKSELVWRKQTPTGKRWFGMGHHVRMEHEVCIIATRGRPKVKQHSTRSVFDADVPEPSLFEAHAMRKHSHKPDEFYALVEQLVDGPYVEMFARQERPGWVCLGDEVPNNPVRFVVRPA